MGFGDWRLLGGMPASRLPPTAESRLQSYEILTLGPWGDKSTSRQGKAEGHGLAEDCCKGGAGAAGAAARSDRGDLPLRCSPGVIAKS
jgi:hypothetical protein